MFAVVRQIIVIVATIANAYILFILFIVLRFVVIGGADTQVCPYG
jgi:hypothetical protein